MHHAARLAASTAGTRGDICSSSHRLPVPQGQRGNAQPGWSTRLLAVSCRHDPQLAKEVTAPGPAAVQASSCAGCPVNDRESPWVTLLTGTWRAQGGSVAASPDHLICRHGRTVQVRVWCRRGQALWSALLRSYGVSHVVPEQEDQELIGSDRMAGRGAIQSRLLSPRRDFGSGAGCCPRPRGRPGFEEIMKSMGRGVIFSGRWR